MKKEKGWESNEEQISEYVPCEMFLEQTGFFSPSSGRIHNLFSKSKDMDRTMSDGNKIKTTLTIDALQRFVKKTARPTDDPDSMGPSSDPGDCRAHR